MELSTLYHQTTRKPSFLQQPQLTYYEHDSGSDNKFDPSREFSKRSQEILVTF